MPKLSETLEDTFCWTIPEFGARYKVTRGTVHNWLNRGLLDSIKIDGTRRILPKHDRAFRERFESGIKRAGTG